MVRERSTKPYLIRAIFEWCSDSGLTPYLSVKVDADTRVPLEYVKNGEIVLNISPDATHRLTIDEAGVRFSARFNGVSRECSVPVPAVTGIFARENNQGLFFPPEPAPTGGETATGEPAPEPTPPSPAGGGKPRLQIVK
jgi:stringent starvation protein B